MKTNAVVLLSGGLDSTVTAYAVREKGREIHALTVRYGQRHSREIESAKKIAKALGAVDHKIIKLDLKVVRRLRADGPDDESPEGQKPS